jgi:hypothetical protein
MSIKAEDPAQDLEIEGLLLQILRELRLQTLIMQETFGQQDIKIGDLDE